MPEPIAKVEMPIRCPVSKVFGAFTDPATITRFWLQSTSGPLVENATVEWHFMVPGAVETVVVREFELDRRIVFTWSDGIRVVLDFAPYDGTATRLSVEASGFAENDPQAVVGATEGFAIVLCDLKAYLETGRSPNLVRDKAALIANAPGA